MLQLIAMTAGLDRPLTPSKICSASIAVHRLCLYIHSAGVYCILNHPIINVHVMGDVVSVSKKNLLIVYEGV